MIKELKNNFMQVSFVTTVWIVLLATVFLPNQQIQITDSWRILGIGTLFGITFGIVYPYLWNYSTFKAPVNILISTLVNVSCGLGGLLLYSLSLFQFIQPYIIPIIILTCIGHIIGFYFYSKYENRQLAKTLNMKLK